MAAILTNHGVAFDCEVSGHVIHSHGIALSTKVFDDPACNFTLVERVATSLGNLFERPPEIRILEQITSLQRFTIRKEQLHAAVPRTVTGPLKRQGRGESVIEDKTFGRGTDRRLDQTCPLNLAATVFVKGEFHTAHHPGNVGKHWPSRIVKCRIFKRRLLRRSGEELDNDRCFQVSQVGNHLTVATETASVRFDNTKRKRDGDRSVNDVTARLKDFDTGSSGDRMGT